MEKKTRLRDLSNFLWATKVLTESGLCDPQACFVLFVLFFKYNLIPPKLPMTLNVIFLNLYSTIT